MANWSLLTAYLDDVPGAVTLSWRELDAIVGGVPASAAKHRAWWSGDRTHVRSWRSAGFAVTDLQMGSRVTFVRRGGGSVMATPTPRTARTMSRPDLAEPDRPDGPVADIVLVSCVKTKRPQAAAAKDLYTSPLFRRERSYAERTGAP